MDETTSQSAIIGILSEATSGASALKAIFWYRKANDKKLSVRFLCQKLKINSTGYLSDVMPAKRRINLAYVKPLATYLGLTSDEAEMLYLMFALDAEKNEEEKKTLKNVLTKKLRLFSLNVMRFVAQDHHTLMLWDVLASFGLFEYKCSLSDILSIWKDEDKERVAASLQELVSMGYVVKENDTYICKQPYLTNDVEHKSQGRLKLLRESYTQAAQRLDTEWWKKETCLFQTVAVTVNASNHRATFKKFQTILLDHITQLAEHPDGDTLLRFTVAVYPSAEIPAHRN